MDVIPKGATVRQILKPIEGKVEATRFNEGTQSLEYHVMFDGEDGEPHGIWFPASAVKAVPASAVEAVNSKEQA